MTTHRFRLYLIGSSPRAASTLTQLRDLCTTHLGAAWEVEVVDVHERPDLADAARIVATPTLDRIEPEPRVRVIGDLSSEALAATLGLPRHPTPQEDHHG